MGIYISRLKAILLGLLLFYGLFVVFSEVAAADGKVWVNTKSGVYHCPAVGITARQNPDATSPENGGNRAAYGARCN